MSFTAFNALQMYLFFQTFTVSFFSIFPDCCYFSLDGHLAGVKAFTPMLPLNSAQLRLLGKLNNLRIELLWKPN